ncbi:hypothetical protein LCGC14_1111950 [marine sediment metagenome]|uniref:Uncharacterized protein n=1 Tax=marine sediment metagenome TaxID=412755 RepID=A0A0F9MB90_9ZZZZ
MDKKNERLRKRRKEDISFKIQQDIKARVNKKIRNYNEKGKTTPPKNQVGIQINLIVNHLILNLPKDWRDKKYHIDHIEPLCSFDLTNKEQFNEAFAINNHRWLLAEDNLKKIKEDRLQSIKLLEK